jgi:hypothetical protein
MTCRGEGSFGVTNSHRMVDFMAKIVIIAVCRRKFEG